jgi:hypothetical protein
VIRKWNSPLPTIAHPTARDQINYLVSTAERDRVYVVAIQNNIGGALAAVLTGEFVSLKNLEANLWWHGYSDRIIR